VTADATTTGTSLEHHQAAISRNAGNEHCNVLGPVLQHDPDPGGLLQAVLGQCRIELIAHRSHLPPGEPHILELHGGDALGHLGQQLFEAKA
jgi:hypothetical protein